MVCKAPLVPPTASREVHLLECDSHESNIRARHVIQKQTTLFGRIGPKPKSGEIFLSSLVVAGVPICCTNTRSFAEIAGIGQVLDHLSTLCVYHVGDFLKIIVVLG